MSTVSTLALACLLATSCAATALDAIVPDAELQDLIAKVPAAQSAEDLEAVLAELKTSGDADYGRLVPQLLYFSARGNDVREGMTAGVVIDRLHISNEQLLQAITPYLDTADPSLQRQLSNLLGAVDEGPDGQRRDFSPFIPLLRQRRQDPPAVLVTHMLDSDPETALRSLATALLDSEEAAAVVLKNAKSSNPEDFDHLAQSPSWWIRYYAVTRLQREPALRTSERTQRLRDDTHPSVRAAAADLPR